MELLAVIAIIGILSALLLVALQSSRESARRLACANNLKQIGLALNNYEAAHGVYPSGTNGGFYSGHIMVLPFLEQGGLYHSLNFECGRWSGGFSQGECNETVSRTRVGVFCCPSDPDATTNAITNYAWNGGLGFQLVDFSGSFCTGGTLNCRYVSSTDIRDGLSNTAAMSEWKIGRLKPPDDSTVVFRVKLPPNAPYADFVQRCQAATRQTTDFGAWKKDARWTFGSYASTLLNFNSLPDSLSCYYDGYMDNVGNWPAGSYHPRSVNVLFHDAHVSHISKSTSIKSWQSISTRSAGDSLD